MKREAQPARVSISEPTSGRVVVTGELTFGTAREARQIGILVLESSRAERIVVDPGEYILHVTAEDYSGAGGGGEVCCWTTAMVKVVVTP